MKFGVLLLSLAGCAVGGVSAVDAGQDAAPTTQLDGGGEPCGGRVLAQSGVLDLPLSSVHVSGTVTLGGQPLPLPAGASSRGTIGFFDGMRGLAVGAELPAGGSASFEVW